MSRENRKNNKKSTNDKIITYGMLGAAILVIAIIAIMTFNDIKGSNSNKYANLGNEKLNIMSNGTGNTQSVSTEIGKTVNEAKTQNTSNTSNTTNTTNTTNTSNTTDLANAVNRVTENLNKTRNTTTAKSTVQTTNQDKGPSFIKPVQGDIIKEFAKDQLIYSNTLEEWTTHMGVDIKAEEGTEVVATENGTIKSIKNDPRYGFVITIEHEDGYQSVYSNLQTSEDVVEGEKIEKGQVIATVGKTAAFESKEESHLHFEMLKDYNQVNPMEFIQ